MSMSTHSCFPFLRSRPTNLDWILKFEHGQLSCKDEIIGRKLFCQLMYTRHVAIVCVLGEPGSGKSVILDALIRRLGGKDASTFTKSCGPPVDGSDELVIAADALVLEHSPSKKIGVLFIDVRSCQTSSLCYTKMMKLACKFATVKLISHHKSLSPNLSKLATECDIIHVKPADVRWDGTKIKLSDNLYGKVYDLIQDAGHAEHTPYYLLEERLNKVYHDEIDSQKRHTELHGHQNQGIQSTSGSQNTPQYMPEPRPSSFKNAQSQSACFGPNVDAKPPEYPQLQKEPQHSQSVPMYEDKASESNQEELKGPEQLMTQSSPSFQRHHSSQINKQLKNHPTDAVMSTGHCQSCSAQLKQGNAFNAKTMCGIAKVQPTVPDPLFLEVYTIMQTGAYIAYLIKFLPENMKKKLKAPSCSPRQIFSSSRSHSLHGCAKVAQSTSSRILPNNVQIRKPAPRDATSSVQTRGQVSVDNSQMFKSEYACAQQAVQFAVAKFKDILPSDLPSLMTAKDQNKLLSSYAAIIMEAFKSTSKGSAWKHAGHTELIPRLDEYMKELRQANKNTVRRWDKALDAALRQCGHVYHAEMQLQLPSKTKVSTTELENHHLNATGPTLKAFSVPDEVNLPTRARWEAVLNAKMEEWKGGFVYLNENSPEPAKIPASLHKKQQASVGIYLGKYAIFFAVVIQDCGRPVEYQKQLSPFIGFSQQGAHTAEDNDDFNIYEILTEPTVPRDSKVLQLGHELHSITQEMAAILYMHEAKQLLEDLCGMDVSFACVGIPNFISGAAKTAIKQSLLMAGFAHVRLLPITIAMAFSLVQEQPHAVGKVISIHHSATTLEISRTAIVPGRGLALEKIFWTDELNTKCLSESLHSINEKRSAPTKIVIAQEKQDSRPDIGHHFMSCDFGIPQEDVYNIEPCDTTLAIAKCAELRRQQLPGATVKHRRPYEIEIEGDGIIVKQDDSSWIYFHNSTTGKCLLVLNGIVKDSGKVEPRWSYKFQVSPTAVSGPVCRIKFEYDGSLGIERLDGDNARVTSETSKFLSQWDREELEEDKKRYLAALAQPDSTGAMSNETYTEQDDSVRGRLVSLIQRVTDSLENPSFVSGLVRDLLVERVELYTDVLANECASDKDLHKALLKLQAVTEGIL